MSQASKLPLLPAYCWEENYLITPTHRMVWITNKSMGTICIWKEDTCSSPAASLISQVIKSSGGEGLCLCGQVIPLWFPGAWEFHSPSCSFPPLLWELCAPDNQGNITNCTGRPWSALDIRKAVCRKCPEQRLCWKQLYSRDYQWPGHVFF